MTTVDPTNPLFLKDQTPRFEALRTEHVVPAVRQLVADQDQAREALEQSATPTWEGLAQPLSDLAEPLSYAWNVVHHLLSVRNTPALREAEQTVQPEVVEAALRLGQSRAFYDQFVALRDGPGWATLSEPRRRIVESSILQAELAGVALEGEAKQRFLAIETELAELSTRFSNNLLDATKAFALVLREPAEVEGLPDSVLAAAAQSAREAGTATAATTARRTRPWPQRPPSAAPGASPWRRRCTCRSWSTPAGATCASGCTGRSSPAPRRASRTTSR